MLEYTQGEARNIALEGKSSDPNFSTEIMAPEPRSNTVNCVRNLTSKIKTFNIYFNFFIMKKAGLYQLKHVLKWAFKT